MPTHPGTKPTPYGTADTSFKAAGEEAGIRKLVHDFYQVMQTHPAAKTVFDMHTEDLDTTQDKLTLFLCGWLGGPKLFREKYESITIPSAHKHLSIGPAEREAWLMCMNLALEKQPYQEEFKQYLIEQLYVPAERSRNRD